MAQISVRRLAANLLGGNSLAALSDAELLRRFAANRDEDAFAAIVDRHGGLVRGTARRCLRDVQAAEDVFQATFLFLSQRAGSSGWMTSVGPWLHAVAVRLARKARSRTAMSQPVPADAPSLAVEPAALAAWDEMCRVLDEELAALSESLRSPLVLCYLQGLTRDEAARACGCSLAMLKRRLERGRKRLHDRLTRRGIGLPAAGIGVLATEVAADASASVAIARAAVVYVERGIGPERALALAGSTSSGRAKVSLLLLGLGVIACGIGLASSSRPDPEQPPAAAVPATASSGIKKTASSNLEEPLPAGVLSRLGSTRLHAGIYVSRMAFSPDGTKVAAWNGQFDSTNDFTIWDTKTGLLLRRVDLADAKVPALVYLPDGHGAAVVQTGFEDVIWDFADAAAPMPKLKPRQTEPSVMVTGGPANQLPPDNERNACYAISPDGKILAIGKAGAREMDRDIQFWELKTGVRVNELKPMKGGVVVPGNCEEIFFTPDGKTLVAVLRAKPAKPVDKNKLEQQVTVWDVSTGKRKSSFRIPQPVSVIRAGLAVSDAALAVGLESGDTALFDLIAGTERKLATGHVGAKPGTGHGTVAVGFSADGKTLITGGRDSLAKLWDVASGRFLRSLPRHHSWVEMLAADPTGKLLASSGQDGVIHLSDLATGKDACPQPGHKFIVRDAALNPDGKAAVTAGWDHALKWWDVAPGAEIRTVEVPDGILGMAVDPGFKSVLVATDAGLLRQWDAATGREGRPVALPEGVKVDRVTFAPDGKHVIGAAGPKVLIWAWPAFQLVRTLDLPGPEKILNLPTPPNSKPNCLALAVSPDGKWLVTVAERAWTVDRDGVRFGYASGGAVEVWEMASGKRIRRLAESDAALHGGTFLADGRFALIGPRAVETQTADGQKLQVGFSAIIPAGGDQPAVEFKGEINLFDPVAGRLLKSFDLPPTDSWMRPSGYAGIGSPDGRTLYVCCYTGEIIVYDVASGKPQRVLRGHQGMIGELAISADGKRLISGGRDGIALVWDVSAVRK